MLLMVINLRGLKEILHLFPFQFLKACQTLCPNKTGWKFSNWNFLWENADSAESEDFMGMCLFCQNFWQMQSYQTFSPSCKSAQLPCGSTPWELWALWLSLTYKVPHFLAVVQAGNLWGFLGKPACNREQYLWISQNLWNFWLLLQ